ncbi:hypothetical protein H1D32_02105 [Anaerobacillus sp. CMMVII]|uniref:spore germination protein GerPC n=1 Tax=Anaerobacillus sp. CMMVII TaxID=2755588 RepID=UPI0021B6ED72|nr:spore germination protein GerPC [Anaerobacillus sp. CMMVII]MCT8136645.1 hypothetical protein [Anaerobacillus sp. CMMVII]
MYYYQWPYMYYLNQPCSLGCTDPSQCQYQQHFTPYLPQQYQNPAYQLTEQQYWDQEGFVENMDMIKKKETEEHILTKSGIPLPTQDKYAHIVMNQLENLQNKLEEIEKENEELKEKVENLKPINIENINYKIQELTVEELSGTLNIGLSALTDAENLKKLLEEKGEIKFNDIDTEALENMDEMEGFNDQ